MEVKIGIQSVPRELVVETDTPAEELERSLSAALEKGDHAVFALSVTKGGRILVPPTRSPTWSTAGRKRAGSVSATPARRAGASLRRALRRVLVSWMTTDQGMT